MLRRCVGSRNLENGEVMTRVGSQRHSKKNIYIYISAKFEFKKMQLRIDKCIFDVNIYLHNHYVSCTEHSIHDSRKTSHGGIANAARVSELIEI